MSCTLLDRARSNLFRTLDIQNLATSAIRCCARRQLLGESLVSLNSKTKFDHTAEERLVHLFSKLQSACIHNSIHNLCGNLLRGKVYKIVAGICSEHSALAQHQARKRLQV